MFVIKSQLKRLAGATVGGGKHHADAIVDKLAHRSNELGVGPRHVGLAHLELRRHRASDPEDGREGQTLLAPKVHLARAGIEAVGGDVRRGRRGGDVIHGALAVIEESARFRKHHKGIFGDVLDGTRRTAIESWEVLLERRLGRVRLDGLEVSCNLAVVARTVVEGLLGAGNGLMG